MAGPFQINSAMASQINPLNNPYWGTSGDGGIGGANGRGVFNWEQLAPLGYDVGMFAETPMDGDVSPGGIDPQATANWLAQNGLQLYEQAGPNGEIFRYVTDSQGQIVGDPVDMATNDNRFFNAALLGIGGAGLAAYGAGVGAASGAAGSAAGSVGGNALSAGLGSATGASGGLTGGSLLTGGALPATGGAGLTFAGAGGAGGVGGLAGYGGVSGGLVAGGTGGAMSSGFLGMSPNTWANLGQTAIGLWGNERGIDAMQGATAESNALAKYVYDTNRADNMPLVNLRNSVLPQIQGLLSNPGSITSDPSYKFALTQGVKARENSAAGRGMVYSGPQGKRLEEFGQDLAGSKLDQSLNRLTNVAGLGQVGSNNNQTATNNYGNTVGGNALNMGGARAGSYIGNANLAGNALGNIWNNWQNQQLNGGP